MTPTKLGLIIFNQHHGVITSSLLLTTTSLSSDFSVSVSVSGAWGWGCLVWGWAQGGPGGEPAGVASVPMVEVVLELRMESVLE